MASSAKHFINDPTLLVNSALRAVTLTNPAVTLDAENKIVYKIQGGQQKPTASIVSGGGSGHEPSFAAMVGPGLLTAAVAGTIFASPSAEQIRTAISSRVPHDGGVLVTVMNYTGDVLNFGMAVEKARAAGVDVEMVVVGDDVGVGRAKAGKVGRRGIAGTVLVHKISGALAARGFSLHDVTLAARTVADNLVSVGASLEHVHVPGRGPPDAQDTLATNEVEIGMGIHNEPGSGRANGLELPALVGTMLKQLLDQADADRAFLKVPATPGGEVVLMINNLGGVSVLELGGITAEVVAQLARDYKIRPVRVLSGTYMTSLNGLGFSISLLNAVDLAHGDKGPTLLDLLDDPAEATGWAAPVSAATWEKAKTQSSSAAAADTAAATSSAPSVHSGLKTDPAVFRKTLENGLKRVIEAEPEVTQYDTVVGDGDCGTGLKRGAETVLEHLATTGAVTDDVLADVAGIVPVIERSMDGTSGAIYAIFLNALVHALRQQAAEASSSSVNWAAALRQSCDALSRYTPARPGDRTLVDALYPFVEKLAETKGDIKAAAAAGRAGAEHTKGMQASLGRTVYIGGSGFEKVPDPGAWGLACFFEGLAE